MIPACAALLPCTLNTRATIVPSPANGWYTKCNPSELVKKVPCPAPATVNVPFAKLALPATPTEPISPSDQTEGSELTAVTVRLTVVVLIRSTDEPATITVTVPVAAVLLAVSVNVLVFAVVLGLNDAVTPLGRPVADKLTLLLKPFCGVIVIVLVPLAPCPIVKLLGDAERM